MGIGCAGFSHIDARQRLLLWAQQFPHCHITSDIQIAIVRRRNGARLGPRGPLPAVELPNCGDVSSYEMPRNLRIYRIMHFALWVYGLPPGWMQ